MLWQCAFNCWLLDLYLKTYRKVIWCRRSALQVLERKCHAASYQLLSSSKLCWSCGDIRGVHQSMVQDLSGVVQPVSQLRQDKTVRILQGDYVPELHVVPLFPLVSNQMCVVALLLKDFFCKCLQARKHGQQCLASYMAAC